MKIFKILTIISLVLMPVYCWAAFNISVTPYEGGFDIRFGKIDPFMREVNKEVVVNITSDIAKQYRLYQWLVDPLANEQGVQLPQNNFFVYGIRGSNRLGTLSVEQVIPVYSGRSIIYTSNSQGSPDTFNLVYQLKGPFDVAPGSYRGRIAFRLEAIDSAQEPVTAYMNIFAEIDVEAKIRIETSTGGRTIRLNAGREEEKSFDLLMEIIGNMASQYKITQMVNDVPVSQGGLRLPEGAIEVLLKEAKKGSGLTQPVALSRNQQVVYTSGASGEADSFVINYHLADLEKVKQGTYRSSIRYLLQGTGPVKEGLIDTLNMEIEIPRFFSLKVMPEMGSSLLFRDLKAGQPPRVNEVLFETQSNTGKPYQVSQNVLYPFTSTAGETIPSRYFTVRTESTDTKGILKYSQKAEVRAGETVLFISDEEGGSDKFKVIYELEIPPDLHAGDYSTRIIYSLLER